MNLHKRRAFFMTVLCIAVHFATSEEEVLCRVDERMNIGLGRIQDPAQILSVGYNSHSAVDCYRACCNYTGSQCNAASFYRLDQDDMCMLLSCRPFNNCVWTTVEGFTAARVQLTMVKDKVPSSPISEEGFSMTSSITSPVTSQQPTEVPSGSIVTEPTIIAVTTQSAFPTDVPNDSTSNAEQSYVESQWDASRTTIVDESAEWNMVNEVENNQPEVATLTGIQTTLRQDSFEQGLQTQGVDGAPDNDPQLSNDNNGPDTISSEWESPYLEGPPSLDGENEQNFGGNIIAPEEEDSGSSIQPTEMKRLLIQSPGFIVGLCSALGVSFLVLVAVCRKVYQSQDRPKYKPLRDYDIRFEPPAASSALLP